ncbi:MAG: peptidoglycan-binding protein [Proteobacteria bacterium]|nr:peptidoglycan-binding protein [Pseudomonadota bacterium]
MLRLGTVDPVDTEEGALGRLFDLGYDTSLPLEGVIREFQANEGLEETGRLDEATQGKLKEAFGE